MADPGTMSKLVLRSPEFDHQTEIPRQFTGDGADISPPLEWAGVPDLAVEFALICDDPDAPTPEPWVHWVLYKIPGDVRELPEGLPRDRLLKHPEGAMQGVNSWPDGNIGYRGPAPPTGHGVHHYRFHLYALSADLHLEPGMDKKSLLHAMAGHVVGQCELVGTYERR